MLRRKFLYLLLLTFTAILAILYDDYIMAILFLLVLLLPMILLGITFYIKKGIVVQLESESKISKKGTNIELRITIKNTTIFPVTKMVLWTSYRHQYEGKIKRETLYVSADGNSEQTVFVNFTVNYCGNIVIKLNTVRIYDYLSIFSFKKNVNQEIKISILPDFFNVEKGLVRENPNVLIESEIFSNIKSGDDPSEIFSMHEYKEGDRMNHIHWKLSLKQDSLMVKDFSQPIDCSVIILVELCANRRDYLMGIDVILEAVLSLSVSLILQKQQHYIGWYDTYQGICKRMKIEQEEDLYEVFSYLFESDLYDRSDAVIRYHFAEFEKEQYSNIMYVTPLLTEDALVELKDTKRNAWCYIIEAGMAITEEEVKKWNTSFGMSILNVIELFGQ